MYQSLQQLEAGLEMVRDAPREHGAVVLIVRRPAVDQRELLDEAELDPAAGLIGDNWSTRGSGATVDGSAHPEMQLNIMNARAAALIAGARDRWALAGDQLYLDLDLSGDNLPPGTRIALGSALIEVTAMPHTGCRKFAERFGPPALKFVNSKVGRELNLRGINAKVVQGGRLRAGDVARRISVPERGHE